MYAARLQAKHAKVSRSIATPADAVNDTKRLLLHRGSTATVLGGAYLGFDLLILSLALRAVHAQPAPGFVIVVMAYIIGALGGLFHSPRASARSAGSPAC